MVETYVPGMELLMDKKNVKDSEEFNFLNEHIMKKRRLGTTGLILFIILGGLLFGIFTCLAFFGTRPYAKYFFEGKVDKSVEQDDVPTDDAVSNEYETTEIIDSVEDVSKGVVVLSVHEEDEWRSTETDINNFSSGLILEVKDDMKVLTSYDFVKDMQTVNIYVEDKRCVGEVMAVSKECGLAIISVSNIKALGDSVLNKIQCVDIAGEVDYYIGEDIVYVGNPYGKERFIANGSLTSIGNAYNIVDVELEIVTTDISETGNNNGFVFNKQGKAIGMVNAVSEDSNVGENLISAISFHEIKPYILKMLQNNHITYLGIFGKVVTDEVIDSIDKDMPYGIYISNTEENSPAYVAGIMNGDIMVKFGGKDIRDFQEFTDVLQQCNVSDEVIVTVMRKGKDGYKEINYTVEIGGR